MSVNPYTHPNNRRPSPSLAARRTKGPSLSAWQRRTLLCLVGSFSCILFVNTTLQMQTVSFIRIDNDSHHGHLKKAGGSDEDVAASASSTRMIPINANSTNAQASPSSGCWRRCKERKNKIMYFMIPHFGAGMNDRVHQFERFIHLAGYLCATFEAARPVAMLTEMHNGGVPISPTLRWRDFIEHRFADTNDLAMTEFNPMFTMNRAKRPKLKHYLQYYSKWNIFDYGFLAPKNATLPKLIITKKLEDFENDFLKAESHSFHHPDDPFVWFIVPNFYDMHDEGIGKDWVEQRRDNVSHPFHSHWRSINKLSYVYGTQNCDYIAPDTMPPHVKHVVKSMIAEMEKMMRSALSSNDAAAAQVDRMKQPTKVFFHIRRGDTLDHCDTNLERVRRYIDCTFGNTHTRSILVIFRSDEQDPSYRRQVLDMLHSHPNVVAVDTDALVWQHMRSAHEAGVLQPEHMINMLAFMVSNFVKWTYSDHVLQLRRTTCPDCDNLAGWMKL